jgi:hypothetical protein
MSDDKDDIDTGASQGIPVCPLHIKRDIEYAKLSASQESVKGIMKASLLVSAGTLGCTIALLVLHFLPSASQTFTLIP